MGLGPGRKQMGHVTSIEETLSIYAELGDNNKGQRAVQSARLATGETFLLLGLNGQGRRAGVRNQREDLHGRNLVPGVEVG